MTTSNMVTNCNLVELDPVIMASDPYDYISGIIRWKLKELIDSRDKIKAEIVEETAKGITNASPYWREDKYLILVHPQIQGGKRVREYVGADPAKIQEAMDKIKRFEDVTSMQWALAHVEERIALIRLRLENLLRELGFTWAEANIVLRFMDSEGRFSLE